MDQETISLLIKIGVITSGQAGQLQTFASELDVLEKKIASLETKRNQQRETEQKLAAEIEKHRSKILKLNEAHGSSAVKVGKLLTAMNAAQKAHATAKSQVANLNNELSRNYATLEKVSKEVDKASPRFISLKNKLEQLGYSFTGAEKDVRDLIKTVREMNKQGFDAMQAKAEAARKTLKGFSDNTQRGFETLSRTIKRIVTTLITITAIRFFRNIIKEGAEFEMTMIRVGATVRATSSEFQALVDVVRKVAKETLFTAHEVSEVSKILAQSGFKTKEIILALEPILHLTASSMGELGETTELVVSILRSFNLGAEETMNVANVLTEATISSRANIERLSVAFRFGGPAAAAFGQSVETTTAVLARLTDLGLSSSIAGTTLRRVFIELSTGAARQIKVLKEINLSLEEVNPSFNDLGVILDKLARTSLTSQQAVQLFGARAASSMYTLIERIRDGGQSLTEFADQLGRAKELNRVEQIFTKLSQTFAVQSLISKSALEDLGLTIFQVFRPLLIELMVKAKNAFSELNDQLQSTTGKKFQDVLVGLIPLIESVIGALTMITKMFLSFSLAISWLISNIPFLNKIVQSFIILIGLLGIKFLLYDKILKSTIVTMLAFNLKMKEAAIGQAKMSGATLFLSKMMDFLRIKSIAARVAMSAFMGVISGGILLVLPYLIQGLISLFGKASDSAVAMGESMDDSVDHIEFATERMQALSNQTGMQIENIDKLNEALDKGQVILANYSKFGIDLAIKIPDVNLMEVFNTEGVRASLINVNDAMHGLENTGKSIGNTFQKDLTDAIKGTLSALEDVQKTVSVKLVDTEYITQATAGLGEINRETVDVMEKTLEDIKKLFPAAKVGETFVAGLVNSIRDGKFEGAFNEQLSAFTEKGLPVFKQLKLELNNLGADQGRVMQIVAKASEAANLQEEARLVVTNAIRERYSKVLGMLALQNSMLSETEMHVKNANKDSNAVIKAQEKLNGLLSLQKGTDETISKLRSVIADEISKGNELIATGNKTDKAKALLHFQTASAQRALLKAAEDTSKEFNRQVDSLHKISAEMELSKAKKAESLAMAALESSKQRRVALELENQRKILKLTLDIEKELFEELAAGIIPAKQFGFELEQAAKKLSFEKSITDISEIKAKIKELEGPEKARIAASIKVAEIEEKISKKLNAIGVATEENSDLEQLAVANSKADAEFADLATKLAKIKTEESNRQLEIQKEINKLREIGVPVEKELQTLIAGQVAEFDKLDLNRYKKLDKANQKFNEQDKIIVDLISKFEKLANAAVDTNNSTLAMAYLSAVEAAEKVLERSKQLRKEDTDEMKRQLEITELSAKATAFSGVEMEDTAKMLQRRAGLLENIKKIEAEIASLEGKRDEGLIDVASYERQTKELKGIRELNNRLLDENPFVVLKATMQSWIIDFSKAHKPVAVLLESFEKIKGVVASFVADIVNTKIESIFGLDSDKEKEKMDKLKKAHQDFLDKLFENEREYLQKLAELELEHRRKLAEINSEFDRERRDTETDIFNERVQRMIELSQLEQQLRYQGLTSEQQRADLLSEIDRNLSSARLGNIEQRQIKLAEIEEQIKALNTLENQLGISREEIEQSSIARLGTLKLETAAFYSDKQAAAVSAIETERNREIEAEKQRFADALRALQRDRELADEKAKLDLDKAVKEINIEDEKNKKLRQLGADLTKVIVKGVFDVVAAKVIAKRVESTLNKLSEAEEKRKTITKLGEETKQIGADQAGTMAKAAKDLVAKLGVAGIILIPAAIALVVAAFAGIFSSLRRNKGGIISEAEKQLGGEINKFSIGGELKLPAIRQIPSAEIKRLPGGIIKGGHGGIDDIHTRLPVHSFIVNRQSTRKHETELSAMVSSVRPAANMIKTRPVAVTANEFYVPPEVYRQFPERINEINRDKAGQTAMESSFYGGNVKHYQLGGMVGPAATTESTRNVTITVVNEFSGLNVLSGDSEDAIDTIYEQGLRSRIQRDIGNRAFV